MKQAITYDDVLLVPSYNHYESRKLVDTSVTDRSGKLSLRLPVLTANMDTVTEHAMANFIGERGGMGVLHRFMPIERNVAEYRLCRFPTAVSVGCARVDVERAAALHAEVASFRQACGTAHMKTIIATGDLGTLANVSRASLVCMLAGADVIKPSTGKETTNATLAVSLVMLRAIREYHEQTGCAVGFKPAGGLRTARHALDWLILVKEELGDAWLQPHLLRLGASALLTDIERQLEHHVTGSYSAAFRHPMG